MGQDQDIAIASPPQAPRSLLSSTILSLSSFFPRIRPSGCLPEKFRRFSSFKPRTQQSLFFAYALISMLVYMSLILSLTDASWLESSTSIVPDEEPENTTIANTTEIIDEKGFKPSNISGVDAILVISPKDKSHPRYTYLHQNEERANLTFNYIERIENDSPEMETFIEMTPGSALRGGQLACWLSHVKMWKLIIEHKMEAAIIMEDDIEVDLHLAQKVEQSYREINSHWPDILLLGHCFTHPYPYGDTLAVDVYWFTCTHGYVLSLQGAYKFLRYLEHDPFHFEFGVDVAMTNLVNDRHFHMMAFRKPVVRQLPRIMFRGDNVSGPDELPMQDMDAPALFSNEEFLRILEHRHPRFSPALVSSDSQVESSEGVSFEENTQNQDNSAKAMESHEEEGSVNQAGATTTSLDNNSTSAPSESDQESSKTDSSINNDSNAVDSETSRTKIESKDTPKSATESPELSVALKEIINVTRSGIMSINLLSTKYNHNA